jgi:hypothetical protein
MERWRGWISGMPWPMRMGNEGENNKILCRTCGDPDCRFYLYPSLAGWANVWRAYGALRIGKFKSGRTILPETQGKSGPPRKAGPTGRRQASFDLYRITEASSKFRRGLRG